MRMEDPGSTTHFSRHPKTMKPKARGLNNRLFFFAITSVITGFTSVIFFFSAWYVVLSPTLLAQICILFCVSQGIDMFH